MDIERVNVVVKFVSRAANQIRLFKVGPQLNVIGRATRVRSEKARLDRADSMATEDDIDGFKGLVVQVGRRIIGAVDRKNSIMHLKGRKELFDGVSADVLVGVYVDDDNISFFLLLENKYLEVF
jgi:hypothetical protein